jgi:hypothetical protein
LITINKKNGRTDVSKEGFGLPFLEVKWIKRSSKRVTRDAMLSFLFCLQNIDIQLHIE